MLFTRIGLELTWSGGSFSGKKANLMFSRSELNSERSASVRRRIRLSSIGFEVSCRGGRFSGDRVSRRLRLSDCHSDSSGSIRPGSSTGLEVSCNGGSFSGFQKERRFSDNDCQTDWPSSGGGKKLRSCAGGASRTGGRVLCSAISSIESSGSNGNSVEPTEPAAQPGQGDTALSNPTGNTRLRMLGDGT